MMTARAHHPPKQRRSQDTLDRILDSAERLLVGSGVSTLDLRAVCAEAGLTTGAVYGRFSGKAGLLDALFDRFDDRSRLAASAYLLDVEGGKYRREALAVDDFIALLDRVYATSGALIAALIEGSYERPELGRRAVAMMSQAADLLLAALHQQGDDVDRERAVAAARLAFAWFDQRLFFRRLGMPVDAEPSIATLRLAMLAVLGVAVRP